MASRSKRLYGPAYVGLHAAPTALYTCPAGKVALVKSIRIFNGSAAGTAVILWLGGTTNAHRVLAVTLAAFGQHIDVDPDPIVLHAGDTLYGSTDATGVGGNYTTVSVHGAEVSA